MSSYAKHFVCCSLQDAPINCCCSKLPRCNLSTSTRVMYTGMLLFTVCLCAATFIPFVHHQLSNHPTLCALLDTCTLSAAEIVHTMITRVLLATACFFLCHAVVSLGVDTSTTLRGRYHNGFWLAKCFLLILCWLVAVFFIPPHDLVNSALWPVIVMISGSAGMLVHLLIIVDFAYSWNVKWVQAYESTEATRYCYGLFIFTSIFFYLSVIVHVGLFVLLGSATACLTVKGCGLVNCTISIIGAVVSVSRTVQTAQPRSGLLQSSMVALYLSYMTWSASISWPDHHCNLDGLSSGKDTIMNVVVKWRTLVPLIIDAGVLLYFSTLANSSCLAGKLLLMSNNLDYTNEENIASYGGQTVVDNECHTVAYSYSLFHLTLALTASHFLLSYTDWLHTELSPLGTITFRIHEATFWFKTVTGCLCGILYIVLLVIPIFAKKVMSNNGGAIIV